MYFVPFGIWRYIKRSHTIVALLVFMAYLDFFVFRFYIPVVFISL